jgi:hypothetical protein
MSLRSLGIGSSFFLAAFVLACGSSTTRSGFASDKSPTDPSDDDDSASIASGDDDDATKGVATQDCSINNRGDGDPNKDYDGDGFPLKNDCNECNKSINKGAMDIPGNGIDEDCSGKADDEPASCDANLDPTPSDAYLGAAALGLCRRSDGLSWGLTDAKFVKPDGTTLSNLRGVGIVPKFGKNKPHQGSSFFVISSGEAKEGAPGDALRQGDPTGTPPGYPKDSQNCSGISGSTASTDARDGAGLLVKIRVPSNAKSFSYEQFFFTQEFPQYVCSSYDDFFVTIMDPKPAGLTDGNIAFDAKGDPIGVNNDLFLACKAGDYTIGGGGGGIFGGGGGTTRHFDCPAGQDGLSGTGIFAQTGGTGWLTTQAPVTGATDISLLFTVWDSGDGNLDSTVLLDNFKWSLEDSGSVDTNPTDVK